MLQGIFPNQRKIYNPMKHMDPIEPLHIKFQSGNTIDRTIYFSSE